MMKIRCQTVAGIIKRLRRKIKLGGKREGNGSN